MRIWTQKIAINIEQKVTAIISGIYVVKLAEMHFDMCLHFPKLFKVLPENCSNPLNEIKLYKMKCSAILNSVTFVYK